MDDFRVMPGQALTSVEPPITEAIPMPARKNNKNETGTGLFRIEENVRPSIAALEMGYEPGEDTAPFPGDPRAGKIALPAKVFA